MQTVSKGERPHIVLVGAVNAGKSTLFNKLLGQDISVVSDQAGTTTDSVSKAIELPGVGPVVLVDTPGLEDYTAIGTLRMQNTRRSLREADIIVLLLSEGLPNLSWLKDYRNIPLVPVVTRETPTEKFLNEVQKLLHVRPLVIGDGVNELLAKLKSVINEKAAEETATITGRLAKEGDTVLLVMPQDSAAPKGRLILPQVQTIRELLDKHCVVMSVQPSELSTALTRLKANPDLIITDSQMFAEVEKICPAGVPLTSFSVLMSAYKGDLAQLIKGAEAINHLTSDSRVLIAEACTHAPEGEDIGTVKIPRLLRKRFGESLRIDHVSGKDFPTDLSSYDLVIHCGACMFNRQHLLSRQSEADRQEVPMTNYGMAIAQLLGILSKVALPD